MSHKDRFNWKSMSDDDLVRRLKEERRRSKRALSKQDRAIAHNNVKAIVSEQTRRYEAAWGL
jgi:hypothetical protein